MIRKVFVNQYVMDMVDFYFLQGNMMMLFVEIKKAIMCCTFSVVIVACIYLRPSYFGFVFIAGLIVIGRKLKILLVQRQ